MTDKKIHCPLMLIVGGGLAVLIRTFAPTAWQGLAGWILMATVLAIISDYIAPVPRDKP